VNGITKKKSFNLSSDVLWMPAFLDLIISDFGTCNFGI